MSDRLTKLLAETAGEQADQIAEQEAEIARLRAATEEMKAKYEAIAAEVQRDPVASLKERETLRAALAEAQREREEAGAKLNRAVNLLEVAEAERHAALSTVEAANVHRLAAEARAAEAEREANALKGAFGGVKFERDELRARSERLEADAEALMEALARCVAALRRARHTGHNLMNLKDYWITHARPACDSAVALYDRLRARRALADGKGGSDGPA